MAKTIMIVDDDPFILQAVEKFLKTKGLDVISMSDPEQAYYAAEEKKPDLIISDIGMPGMDGFALLRALKRNQSTSKIPSIFLTASDKVEDVEKGFACGAQAYILKPIDWERAWTKIQPLLTSS